MGGKNRKYNNQQQQKQSNTKEPSAQAEQVLQQLLEISQLLKNYKKRLRQSEDNFGYIISTRWLGNWKEYTGYNALMKQENPEDSKGFGKKKPASKINDDLMAKHDAKLIKIPQSLEKYSYLNVQIDSDYENDKEFIIIDRQLWMSFSEKYSDAITIKREMRKKKSGQPYIDPQLHSFHVVIVTPQIISKCRAMTQAQYDKILKRNKKDDTLQKMMPVKKISVSGLWKMDKLQQFFKEVGPAYCQVDNKSTLQLWKMQNYLSFGELRQNLLSYFRGSEIGILGNQMNNGQDIEDFVKSSSVVLALFGDLELVRLPPPNTPKGYCEQCIEDKELNITCLCKQVFYCSMKCLHVDKPYHGNICEKAYDSDDDEEYIKKSVYVDTAEVKCGLNNLGNTCYMNSSLQCLTNLSWLFDYYSSNKYFKQIPKQELEQNKGIFVNKFSKFVKKMNEWETYSPYSMKTQIGYFIAPFKGFSQHDANDFIVYFLNTLNDFIQKQGQCAFGELIRQNLAGKFKSSVTCPDCKMTSVTEDVYLQLSLPIKTKVAEKQMQFIIVKDWNQYSKGTTLMSTWSQIASEIGQSKNCRKFIGSQGGDMKQILQESVDQIYKKYKKQTLIFYPNLKQPGNLAQIRLNLAYSKIIAGNQMKTVYGFPIIIQVDPKMKLWELYLLVAKTIRVQQNGLQQIINLKSIIQKQIELYRQIFKEQKQKQKIAKQSQSNTNQTQTSENSQTQDQEAKLQIQRQKQKQQQQQLQNNILKIQQNYAAQTIQLRNNIKFRLSVVTNRKGKKLCSYCNKKCSLCILPFSLTTCVEQFQKKGDSDLEIDIYLEDKKQIVEKYSKSKRNQYTTLTECLEEFSKPQLLDQQNAWYCQVCDMMRLAQKELKICQYPKTMIIQLKRFKQNNGKKVKNNEVVWYPQVFYIEQKQIKYQLSGIVVHEGSLEGGHYWAVCRKGKDYYLFNDSEVKKVGDYFQKGAYILIYESV